MASLLRGLVRDYQERVLTGKDTHGLLIIQEPDNKRNRVNMYASAWICTKVQDLAGSKEPALSRPALLRSRSSTLEEIHLES